MIKSLTTRILPAQWWCPGLPGDVRDMLNSSSLPLPTRLLPSFPSALHTHSGLGCKSPLEVGDVKAKRQLTHKHTHMYEPECAWAWVCVCNYRNLMERGLYLQYSSLYLNMYYMYYYTPIIHTLCSLRGWNINPSKVWHPIISCVIQQSSIRSQAWSISTVSISCEMDEPWLSRVAM